MQTCKFAPINSVEKNHSMIETHLLKNVVIFIQAILSFVLSRKIINIYNNIARISKCYSYRFSKIGKTGEQEEWTKIRHWLSQ